MTICDTALSSLNATESNSQFSSALSRHKPDFGAKDISVWQSRRDSAKMKR
jgi:hypothetical protein